MTSSVDEGSSAARTVTGTAEADLAPVVAQAGSRADADSTTRGAADPPSTPTDPPTARRAEDAPSEPAERPSDATPEDGAAEDGAADGSSEARPPAGSSETAPAPAADVEAPGTTPATAPRPVDTRRTDGGPAEGDAKPAWHRRFRPRIGAPTIAVLTWAAAYPGGAALVKIVDADPFTARGALVPAGAAIVGGLLLFALALWRSSDRIVGLVAGGYAAWVGLTLIASYNGSPFGDSGLRGDSARLAAMATKFTVHTQPVDGIVSSVPSEYPPLFPFLLGRLALELDQPAWSLIGYGEATLISLAVVVAFVLWRGIVPAWVALALAVLPPWVFSQPRKSYEIVTLAVFVPWVLRTFTDRSRREGGLHWLAAGVIGGLLLMTYQGYVMFAAVGLVVLVVGSFWRSRHRWRYLGHLVGVGATAFVVAAWYLIPYLRGTLTIGGSRVNDYFISPAIVEDPLGVWYLKAPLSAPLHVLQICGLVGLAWYWRKRWWARPLLLVLLGAYAYRWAFVLIFMHNGHTLYLHYTTRLIGLVLASGGILALVEAGRVLAARLRVAGSLRRVALVGTAGLLVLAGLSGAGTWMPSPPGLDSVKRPAGPQNYNLAVYTHAEPLPDGSRQRYPAPDEVTVTWFPAEPIRRVVHETLGPDALPVTLSYDERMYAYQPWPGYMAVERLASNTWTHWDDRRAEVVRLTGITDPAEFARATKDTRFGEIDVFVLRRRPAGWHFGSIVFNPKQFDPAVWRIDDTVPNGVVVAVRKPGT